MYRPLARYGLKPARYTCYRAAGPIAVDGKLDEPSWQIAPKSTPFVDIVTGDTDQFYWGAGTFASRGAVVAGNAVNEAAKAVRQKILKLAADERPGGFRKTLTVQLERDSRRGFHAQRRTQHANRLRQAPRAELDDLGGA